MGKAIVSFTPYIVGEHRAVVVFDNLEKVPSNQELAKAFFQALTGISEEYIKEDLTGENDILLHAVMEKHEMSTMPVSEKCSDENIETPVTPERKSTELSNRSEFQVVAKNYLSGLYDEDEAEKKEMQRKIFDFLKREFQEIDVQNMNDEELNEFFKIFSIAIGKKTMKLVLEKYSSWEEFIEEGYLEDKRMVCERIIKTYIK